MELLAPTLDDVIDARSHISAYLRPTAFYQYPILRDALGADVWVKHENHQPVGAFKVRGGINLVSRLSEAERSRGVIAASTGNHGQSVAYASRMFGVDATICVPTDSNPVKVAAMESLGARVVHNGRDFDEAREHCERLAREYGYRYIHSGDEPHLIAGVGTYTLEMLEQEPDIDVIIVPIGGGSGAAGACIVAKALRSQTQVIGVQSEAAPAAYLSWKQGRLVVDEMKTFAEGLATRTGFELPQRIFRDHLDDFVLVPDDDIRRAMVGMIEATRNLVEAAGAAALAGARVLKERVAGKKVALVCSGGNVTLAQLKDVLANYA